LSKLENNCIRHPIIFCYFTGAVLPDGTINWDCPCISRDLTGPCGYEMRQALSCIQKEAATPECRAKHVVLQECLQANSSLYPWVNEDKDDSEDDDNGDEEETMKIAENMISEAEEKSS